MPHCAATAPMSSFAIICAKASSWRLTSTWPLRGQRAPDLRHDVFSAAIFTADAVFSCNKILASAGSVCLIEEAVLKPVSSEDPAMGGSMWDQIKRTDVE